MNVSDSNNGRKALGKASGARRGLNIDPSGHYLYAAGQASGKLAAYRINQTTGKLKPLATYPVGDQPWCVLAVTTD